MAHVLSHSHTETAAIRTVWAGTAGRVRTWLTLWSERRSLERLDERMLRDIGLDEGSARAEAARPMWDVPAHRQPTAM